MTHDTTDFTPLKMHPLTVGMIICHKNYPENCVNRDKKKVLRKKMIVALGLKIYCVNLIETLNSETFTTRTN